jgi:hypothetical protein
VGTTIGCGTGNDIVNVGSLAPAAAGVMDGIAALLTVNGQDGADTLNLDDSGDANDNTGTLSASAIGGLDMAGSLSYTLFESLNLWLGAGSDTLTVVSTHAGSSWIAAGAGGTRSTCAPSPGDHGWPGRERHGERGQPAGRGGWWTGSPPC